VGVVEISHDGNSSLRDRTSREGLIENEAYEDLCAMVRGAIMVFEVERLRDRTLGEQNTHMDATRALEDAGEASRQTSLLPVYSAMSVDPVTIPQKTAASPLRQTRGFVSKALDRKLTEERHEELYSLAAAGLRLEKLEHQFSAQAHQALTDLGILKRKLADDPTLLSHLASVETGLNVLRNAIRALAPDGPVSQAERTSSFEIGEAIEDALRPQAERIESYGVMLEQALPEEPVMVRGRRACIVQVLGIVFDNAVYWASRGSDADPVVRVGWDPDVQTLFVGDSGPGIDVKYRERVFEPYFALRPDGRGLGLHIARDLIQHQGGALYLTAPEESPLQLQGATFGVRLEIDREDA
jgi:signal transduction histidine kinase